MTVKCEKNCHECSHATDHEQEEICKDESGGCCPACVRKDDYGCN